MARRPGSLAFVVGLALFAGPVPAFHSGGAGSCSGCHSGHSAPPGGTLLKSPNPSDVCLSCHATQAGNTWGGDVVLPGPIYGAGPFVFLTEDNLNDGADGSTAPIPGSHAGHNVVSFLKGTSPDPDRSVAPGGSYPSSSLTCISCHDPHGKGGHYRMLYGADSGPSRSLGYEFTYTTPAPEAVGIDVESAPESPGNHNAYRSGMSEWCGNCHGAYHAAGGTSAFTHVVDVPLSVEVANTYNLYRGTGFLDGTPGDSYLPMVPLEVAGSGTSFRGPATTTSRINCLSCHRAHASSGTDAGRWDFTIATWADEGKSGSWPIPNPYETTAGPAQKRLCEKCHGASGP